MSTRTLKDFTLVQENEGFCFKDGGFYLRGDGQLSHYGYWTHVNEHASDPCSAYFPTEKEAQKNLNKHYPSKRIRKPRKKRVYYKVVRLQGYPAKYISAAGAPPTFLNVEYKVGEVAVPKLAGSKLFVFGSLDAARLFKSSEMLSPCKIFECEVTNPHRTKLLGKPCEADDFWAEYFKVKGKRKKLQHILAQFTRASIPRDSYSVDSVKLLKEVV